MLARPTAIATSGQGGANTAAAAQPCPERQDAEHQQEGRQEDAGGGDQPTDLDALPILDRGQAARIPRFLVAKLDRQVGQDAFQHKERHRDPMAEGGNTVDN